MFGLYLPTGTIYKDEKAVESCDLISYDDFRNEVESMLKYYNYKEGVYAYYEGKDKIYELKVDKAFIDNLKSKGDVMKGENKKVTFSASMLKRTKALIAKAKKEGKIKNYTEAFKDCPVEKWKIKKDVDLFKSDLISSTNMGLGLITRIDKAVDYINHSQNYGTMAHLKSYVNGDEVLNILKGNDKE